MRAAIQAIEFYLPESTLTTQQLAREFPDWSVEKIDKKTGVSVRHIAAPGECSSDLAVRAAVKLFASEVCERSEIDFILFCTQSPNYLLPTTACLIQDRLGLKTSVGALDFNLGCSGYVYGLALAKGLIETGQARTVLLLTAETYSKFINPTNRSVRTIFGDAGAATLLRGIDDVGTEPLGPFLFGTDGRGGENLIVKSGGLRQPLDESLSAGQPGRHCLFMNGPEIFAFTLQTVPSVVRQLLAKAQCERDEVDLYVFHQANRYMLESLRNAIRIKPEAFVNEMSETGNTVSSTIPIALKQAEEAGRLRDGARVMLVGFGVGYSWSGCVLQWTRARETKNA
jgi:3-oxoacyl-[acyl-carrier-protein] synthase-3